MQIHSFYIPLPQTEIQEASITYSKNSGNASYCSGQSFVSSSKPSISLNVETIETVILPLVLYWW
jgi:hypothetical protein